MAKYRKKPVVIEAVQFTGDNTKECCLFIGRENISSCSPSESIGIITLEGTMRADIGDYIIKGVQGEFCPCKPNIFEATYEEVMEDEQTQ